MPKRTVKNADDGTPKMTAVPYECEKLQRLKGDKASDAAWSERVASKPVASKKATTQTKGDEK